MIMTTHKNEGKMLKKPWPTKAAMEQVYTMKLWGENNTSFYSGEGSHDTHIITPYLDAVTAFLTSFKKPLVICDLGCGDFNIGKNLVSYSKKYIAVDIVEPLIAYNKIQFKADNLDFKCLDLATDNLPQGDCAILRQVLQHLSNTEVQNIVNKLSSYKYLIITEHVPNGNFIPNEDIISGQGTRLKKQSGLDLLVSPFNFKIKSKKRLSHIELENNKGVILTMLYEVL